LNKNAKENNKGYRRKFKVSGSIYSDWSSDQPFAYSHVTIKLIAACNV